MAAGRSTATVATSAGIASTTGIGTAAAGADVIATGSQPPIGPILSRHRMIQVLPSLPAEQSSASRGTTNATGKATPLARLTIATLTAGVFATDVATGLGDCLATLIPVNVLASDEKSQAYEDPPMRPELSSRCTLIVTGLDLVTIGSCTSPPLV